MTISLKTPKLPQVSSKLPKVNKKVLLITAGALVVLGLFSFAVVNEVRAERAQKATDAAVQAKQAQADKERSALIDRQTAQLTAATARTDAACNYIKSLAAAKATARLVTVPAACK